MPDFKHSFSTTSCYLTCPRQFQEKYVLKTIKFVQNEAAKYGSEGHKVCEDAVNAKTLPSGRWSFVAPTIQSIYNSAGDVELRTEHELGISEDKQPAKFWDGWLRGKLDLYYKHDPEKGTILDYKFARYQPTKYDLEVDVFSYLSWMNDPELDKIKRVLVWLKQESPGKPTVTGVSRKEDFNRIEDSVLGKIAKVERSLELDSFPCTPSGLCSWCDVKSCKFWKARK